MFHSNIVNSLVGVISTLASKFQNSQMSSGNSVNGQVDDISTVAPISSNSQMSSSNQVNSQVDVISTVAPISSNSQMSSSNPVNSQVDVISTLASSENEPSQVNCIKKLCALFKPLGSEPFTPLSKIAFVEQRSVHEIMTSICANVSTHFDLNDREGNTDYLDFISESELPSSTAIVTGTDKFGREFITVKFLIEYSNGRKRDFLQTFFRRSSDNKSWQSATCYTLKDGIKAESSQLLYTGGGLQVCQALLLETICKDNYIKLLNAELTAIRPSSQSLSDKDCTKYEPVGLKISLCCFDGIKQINPIDKLCIIFKPLGSEPFTPLSKMGLAERRSVHEIMTSICANVPTQFNLNGRMGSTGYLDFLSENELPESTAIVVGTDKFNRQFITVKFSIERTNGTIEKLFQTFFRRYSDGNLWQSASGYTIEDGGRKVKASELFHTSGGLYKCQALLLETVCKQGYIKLLNAELPEIRLSSPSISDEFCIKYEPVGLKISLRP
jgi:hypothetical protein